MCACLDSDVIRHLTHSSLTGKVSALHLSASLSLDFYPKKENCALLGHNVIFFVDTEDWNLQFHKSVKHIHR